MQEDEAVWEVMVPLYHWVWMAVEANYCARLVETPLNAGRGEGANAVRVVAANASAARFGEEGALWAVQSAAWHHRHWSISVAP